MLIKFISTSDVTSLVLLTESGRDVQSLRGYCQDQGQRFFIQTQGRVYSLARV